MRSWIFVIGAAAMGVASVIGFYFATARAEHRAELLAETPGKDASSPLPDTKWLIRCNAMASPLNFRCASCHAAFAPTGSPFARRAN